MSGNGAAPQHVRVAIIGSGFGGLGMAIRLKEAGIHSFAILEKAGEVGGTWRENTYPGIECDVPSHVYSFSFAPNPDWSRTFAPGHEIQEYLCRVATEYGVRPYIRFGHEVTQAGWDEDAQRWLLETTGGAFTAQVVVAAMGPLSIPMYPSIAGLESFEGKAFHSAEWDHDHDLTGERVAVIGTGASAIQFVPEIQPKVGRLHVFQRTAPWVVPRYDREITSLERRVYRRFPALQQVMRGGIYAARESLVLGFLHPRLQAFGARLARRHLERQVEDPVLRRKLTPHYTFGCKRVLISNAWYPALVQPNVDLISDPIAEVRPRSIVTEGGAEHEVDTIVYGTGFHVTDFPGAERVRGRGGRLLSDVWGGGPNAYLGTSVAGFPNLFFLVGPNSGLGHNSIVYMIESQVAYVVDALRSMDQRGASTVEVRPEVQEAFNRELDEQMRGTVWTSGGCESYYLDASGRNSTIWPGFTWTFRHRTRRFDVVHYALGFPAPEREPVVA